MSSYGKRVGHRRMCVAENDTSQSVKREPDDILQEYRSIETDINFGGLSIENVKKSSRKNDVEMKSDNIFMSEINAGLWERGLKTAIGDISHVFYPHSSVVEQIIKHTLNSHIIDIGLTKCFFMKLVLFHPPKSEDLQKYYWFFVNEIFLGLNSVKREENAFWCLIDVLLECLDNEECMKGMKEEVFEESVARRKEKLKVGISPTKNMLVGVEELCPSPRKKDKKRFGSLPPSEQVQRVLIILEFMCNVLEADFREKMKEDEVFMRNKCLLSDLIWENRENVGLMNGKVKKLIHVWFMMEKANFCHFLSIHSKLLALVAEITRGNDAADGTYPFLGHKTDSFANEVSVKFKCLTGNMRIVRMVKPHWLRMLACSELLSRITGESCPPELTTAHDILECVAKVHERTTRRTSKQLKETRVRSQRMSGDVKSCVCMLNKAKKPKLSDDAGSNPYNRRGWTALHEAVLNGHGKCVQKLLKKSKQKSVDARRKGVYGMTPLMCAVVTDNARISTRLLEQTGSELLTDVDENGRTPMDFCRSKEVYDVLESFDTGMRIGEDELETAVVLCVLLVESYFITHRTWDLWKCRFRWKKSQAKPAIKWDRDRCETDVQTNVVELTKIVTKLTEFKEFSRLVEPLKRILDFKKFL